MTLEKLAAIEERLLELLERLGDYRHQNSSLQERVRELEGSLREQTEQLDLQQREGDSYNKLLHENKKLVEERDVITSKIEGLLNKLDELDL